MAPTSKSRRNSRNARNIGSDYLKARFQKKKRRKLSDGTSLEEEFSSENSDFITPRPSIKPTSIDTGERAQDSYYGHFSTLAQQIGVIHDVHTQMKITRQVMNKIKREYTTQTDFPVPLIARLFLFKDCWRKLKMPIPMEVTSTVRQVILSSLLCFICLYTIFYTLLFCGAYFFMISEQGQEHQVWQEYMKERNQFVLDLYNNKGEDKATRMGRVKHFIGVLKKYHKDHEFDPRFGPHRDSGGIWSYGGSLLHISGLVATVSGHCVRTTAGQLMDIISILVVLPIYFMLLSQGGFLLSTSLTLLIRVYIPKMWWRFKVKDLKDNKKSPFKWKLYTDKSLLERNDAPWQHHYMQREISPETPHGILKNNEYKSVEDVTLNHPISKIQTQNMSQQLGQALWKQVRIAEVRSLQQSSVESDSNTKSSGQERDTSTNNPVDIQDTDTQTSSNTTQTSSNTDSISSHFLSKEGIYIPMHTPIGFLDPGGDHHRATLHVGTNMPNEDELMDEKYNLKTCQDNGCELCEPTISDDLLQKETLNLYEYRIPEMILTIAILFVYIWSFSLYLYWTSDTTWENAFFYSLSVLTTAGITPFATPIYENPRRYRVVPLMAFLHFGLIIVAACFQPTPRPNSLFVMGDLMERLPGLRPAFMIEYIRSRKEKKEKREMGAVFHYKE